MNRPALHLCCLLALAFGVPALGEAARYHEKEPRPGVEKKQAVLKAARNVPARMAIAAKAARPATKKSHGSFVRRPVQLQRAVVPVAARSLMPRSVVMGGAQVHPGSGLGSSARKSFPQRMYASDGDAFYFNGRKYRVEGVPAALAKQEITKQRLQQLLDSGDVSIEPRTIDDAGLTTAVIRVAGRDVSESLR